MKTFSTVIGTLGIVVMLIPAPANAQQTDLRPGLTNEAFADLAADFGSVLRVRQLGEATTLDKGTIDVGVEFASAAIDDSKSFPRIFARLGVGERVDIGAWGGFNNDTDYGVAGFDTRIVLLREGPSSPVSVAIRPSVASLVGTSEVWVGSASIDLSVSRTLGSIAPYAGVATTGTVAIERSDELDLDPATANGSLAYVGLSYHWRALSAAAEVQKGSSVSYAVRIGTRF